MTIIALFPRRRKSAHRRSRWARPLAQAAPTTIKPSPADQTQVMPATPALNTLAPFRGSMPQRKRVDLPPYRPAPLDRTLRRAQADVEDTAALPVVPASGPTSLKLPAHEQVTVVDGTPWRPPVAENAVWADAQTRVLAVSSLIHSDVDDPWFRLGNAVNAANDRSLRAFHERWSTPDARAVFLNQPSPRTLAFTMLGESRFDQKRVAA